MTLTSAFFSEPIHYRVPSVSSCSVNHRTVIISHRLVSAARSIQYSWILILHLVCHFLLCAARPQAACTLSSHRQRSGTCRHPGIRRTNGTENWYSQATALVLVLIPDRWNSIQTTGNQTQVCLTLGFWCSRRKWSLPSYNRRHFSIGSGTTQTVFWSHTYRLRR